MNRDDIQRGLETHGLGEHASELLALAAPSIRLKSRRVEPADLPIGASRLGGFPDIPEQFDWPADLAFIGQVDLAEVAVAAGQTALPEAGWLYFFYDVDEQPWGFDPAHAGGWRVVYGGSGTDLKRPALSDLPQGGTPFQLCGVDFMVDWTLPSSRSTVMRVFQDQFQSWWNQVRDGYYDLLGENGLGYANHRLLGHPVQIQGDMQLECQLVSHGLYCGNPSGYSDPRARDLQSGATDWQLLLQVDTDDDLNAMWGDVGMIYYWIRRDDLRAQQFDSVWLIQQCF